MGDDIVVKTHGRDITDEELNEEVDRIKGQKRLTR